LPRIRREHEQTTAPEPPPIIHGLVITKASGVNSLEEVIGPQARKQLKLGLTAPGSATSNGAYLSRQAIGLNFKPVTGYDGIAQVVLAMENGEVDGTFNSIDQTLDMYGDRIKSGEWKIIAATSDQPHPRAPSVPYMGSLIKDPEKLQLLRLGVMLPLRFSFLYFMPPDVPTDRAEMLEDAFWSTMADPEFVAGMEKGGNTVSPIPADDIHSMVSQFLNMPDRQRSNCGRLWCLIDKQTEPILEEARTGRIIC
jgi:tripartite-type tricarboxylate transporter receptor subunit TctC